MSHDMWSEVPIWIKWFTLADLNQMIHARWFEVLIWIKWFKLVDLKSRSESNESRYVIWSPGLNWLTGLTDTEFRKAQFHQSLHVLFKTIKRNVEIHKLMALLNCFFSSESLDDHTTEWLKSRVWINRSGVNDSLNWFNLSVPLLFTSSIMFTRHCQHYCWLSLLVLSH